MKRRSILCGPAPVLVLSLCLSASPLVAEEAKPGRSLMQEGVQLFLKGLQKEIEPALEELGAMAEELGPALDSFADEMGPALGRILQEVEDWSAYHPPEMQPNGDILIRRKPGAAPPEPLVDPEETEL